MDKVREALEKFAKLADNEKLKPMVASDDMYISLGLMNGNVTQSVLHYCLQVGDFRKAKEAIEALSQDNWQPISTAPKDGSSILIYSSQRCDNCRTTSCGMSVAKWMGYWRMGRTIQGVDIGLHHEPTDWQPLPNPPEKK